MTQASIQPLTEAEFDKLEEFLFECGTEDSFNGEELDGFLCALLAGPVQVPLSEYLPIVFGGEPRFRDLDHANQFLRLLMRHWNSIAAELNNGEPHLPKVWVEEDGTFEATDWAIGFLEGVGMRKEAWAEIFDNDHMASWIFPMLMLASEHNPDPELRPPEITMKIREELLALMAGGTLAAFQHFQENRRPKKNKATPHKHRRMKRR